MNLNSDEPYSLRKLKELFQPIPANFGSFPEVYFDWKYLYYFLIQLINKSMNYCIYVFVLSK